jgi:alpha-glutamyl/putrescinyl thymine pyrophosphorylase clade 1
MTINDHMFDHFRYWMTERWNIHVAKDVEGLPGPWTADPILKTFRFCNVHREDDKVTKWIKTNWRDPYKTDHMLPFNMAVARLINFPPTLQELEYTYEWTKIARDRFRNVLAYRKEVGLKTYSSAYMVTGTESRGMAKMDFVILLLDRLWEQYQKLNFETLESCAASMTCKGLSTFLVGQVIADVKYTPFLENAPDWWAWCAPGPGSIRGLHRLHMRDYTKSMGKEQFLDEINELRARKVPLNVHAQDLQNCLCEYDKWMRVQLKQGTPKQLYVPSAPGEFK